MEQQKDTKKTTDYLVAKFLNKVQGIRTCECTHMCEVTVFDETGTWQM